MIGAIKALFSGAGVIKSIENIASEWIETEQESAEARKEENVRQGIDKSMEGINEDGEGQGGIGCRELLWPPEKGVECVLVLIPGLT